MGTLSGAPLGTLSGALCNLSGAHVRAYISGLDVYNESFHQVFIVGLTTMTREVHRRWCCFAVAPLKFATVKFSLANSRAHPSAGRLQLTPRREGSLSSSGGQCSQKCWIRWSPLLSIALYCRSMKRHSLAVRRRERSPSKCGGQCSQKQLARIGKTRIRDLPGPVCVKNTACEKESRKSFPTG